MRLEDSGRYQCKATNGFGHRTVDFTVHVYGKVWVLPPNLINSDPEDTGVSVKDKLVLSNTSSAPNWLVDMDLEWSSPVQVNRGGRLELRCPSRGNPMPEIRWYKNNMLLSSGEIKKKSGLTSRLDAPPHIASFVIDPANPEDSGDYRCLVENRLGSIDAVFKVTVGDFFENHTFNDVSIGFLADYTWSFRTHHMVMNLKLMCLTMSQLKWGIQPNSNAKRKLRRAHSSR